jgi:tetratricopeptide (TPR) repeat protein
MTDAKPDQRRRFAWVPTILIVLLIAFFVGRDLHTASVIVGTISVPEVIKKRGLTEDTAQRLLIAKLVEVAKNAESDVPARSVIDNHVAININLPTTQLTIEQIINATLDFLGQTDRISGDVVADKEAPEDSRMCFVLHVANEILRTCKPTIDELFDDAAFKAMEIVDPYVALSYALNGKHSNLERAKLLIGKMLANKNPAASAEAHLGLAYLAQREKDGAGRLDAIDSFRAANAIYKRANRDQDWKLALDGEGAVLLNMAIAEQNAGNQLDSSAKEKQEKAQRENDAGLEESAKADHAAAEPHLREATRLFGEAEPFFLRVVEKIDPTYDSALYNLGRVYEKFYGDKCRAFEVFKLATVSKPENAIAQEAAGDMLLARASALRFSSDLKCGDRNKFLIIAADPPPAQLDAIEAEAEEYFLKAISADPNAANPRMLYGTLKYQQCKFQVADELYKEALDRIGYDDGYIIKQVARAEAGMNLPPPRSTSVADCTSVVKQAEQQVEDSLRR